MVQDKSDKKIAIIGGGHIGLALRRGLLKSGVSKSRIIVSNDAAHNRAAAESAYYIFLAVRPLVVPAVFEQIKDLVKSKLVISTASVSKNTPVRIMPNLGIAHGKGVIGLYVDKTVPRADKANLKKLLSGLGLIVDCKKESDIDTFTVMSGSGVGIASYLMQMLSGYGVRRGMSQKLSQEVATAVFTGAIECLTQDKATFSRFIDAVATKGGTTEAILAELTKQKIPKSFLKAMSGGEKRIKKLKYQLSRRPSR